MSIMNARRMPQYRQGGGYLEEDITYAAPAQALPNTTSPGFLGIQNPNAGPNISGDQTFADATQTYVDWNNNPANAPQYYTGETNAGFDPAQLQAQQRTFDAAGQADTLTNQRIGAYQEQLDPNSEYNQLSQQRAQQGAANAYFGAGTPGSSRGQYASSLASLDSQHNNRNTALQGLAGAQKDLFTGADRINQVGASRQLQTQRDIDEDIKRYNFSQLSPQTQADKQLALKANEEAIRLGNQPISTSNDPYTNSRGFDYLKYGADQLGPAIGKAIFGGLFSSEGGPVQYRQGGGIIGQNPGPGGMSPQAMAPQQAMQQPQMMQQPAPPPGPMPSPMEQQGGLMEVEEMSEIDMIEDQLNAMALASGGDIVVTRKETRRKTK